jgi:hypothetical protein
MERRMSCGGSCMPCMPCMAMLGPASHPAALRRAATLGSSRYIGTQLTPVLPLLQTVFPFKPEPAAVFNGTDTLPMPWWGTDARGALLIS